MHDLVTELDKNEYAHLQFAVAVRQGVANGIIAVKYLPVTALDAHAEYRRATSGAGYERDH